MPPLPLIHPKFSNLCSNHTKIILLPFLFSYFTLSLPLSSVGTTISELITPVEFAGLATFIRDSNSNAIYRLGCRSESLSQPFSDLDLEYPDKFYRNFSI